MSPREPGRRLYRSRSNRVVAGVCGGIAEYFGWNPTVVRLAVLASFILPGTQIIFYLVAWIVIPNEP
ncbi:MAG TPA: PspC domain-containing protein [Euzebyales bacterium]|nr:PspC domain-containing protein [Euzebyales bacterium]